MLSSPPLPLSLPLDFHLRVRLRGSPIEGLEEGEKNERGRKEKKRKEKRLKATS